MDLNLLIRGMIIGFSIAAPVGPIGVLCIRRTLAEGRAYGLASGLGAASADAFFGTIAALGLTLVANFLAEQQAWLSLIGGSYLLYLGFTTFRSKPAERSAEAQGKGLLGAYTSTLFLTLTNPLTILSFAAVFAGLGLAAVAGNYVAASALVAGVFIGSAAWWLTLCLLVGWLRTRLDAGALRWVNRLAGLIIAGFGLWALWQARVGAIPAAG